MVDDNEFAIALESSLGLQLAGLLDNAQDGLEFALLHNGSRAGAPGSHTAPAASGA